MMTLTFNMTTTDIRNGNTAKQRHITDEACKRGVKSEDFKSNYGREERERKMKRGRGRGAALG